MDGYQMSFQINKLIDNEKFIPACIIAITSNEGKQHQQKCMECGIIGTCTKPANSRYL
jgi:CheY-like chemotaxis protein